MLPEELDISTLPLEVIGAPLVNSPELPSLTVAALMAPLPVSNVESALVISRFCAAVIVAVVLEYAAAFPEIDMVTFPLVDVTFAF